MIRKPRRAASAVMAALALAAVLGTAAPAQTPPRNQAEYDAMVKKQREEFFKKIGVTAAQKSKIDAIQKKYEPSLEKINKKYEPRAKALQQQMAALQKKMMELQQEYGNEMRPVAQKMDKELEAVLTPAQRAKVKELQKQQQP